MQPSHINFLQLECSAHHRQIFYKHTMESVPARLTSLTLREPPMSLRCLLGVPWLHPPGVPPSREEGVPRTRGELMSISEVGKLAWGEEMRGRLEGSRVPAGTMGLEGSRGPGDRTLEPGDRTLEPGDRTLEPGDRTLEPGGKAEVSMCSEEGGEATADAARLLPGGARERGGRKGVGFGLESGCVIKKNS